MEVRGCSVETLQKSVSEYKNHIAQISDLHRETIECFHQIQELVSKENEKGPVFIPALQLPPFDFSNCMPCVLFIGSQNCGKSTLLNTFLRKNALLPTHQTPCTSRIVRIVYNTENSVKLENDSKNKTFKRKIPSEYIALKDDDRQNIEKLKTIVEVGIKHELLECGIELIDSPGRNENDALNRVVEEFIQKGIVPLIVYIVDGNNHIQAQDRITIRNLQDKFPDVSLMFVCSKVDIDMKAKRFNADEEDAGEDDEDEALSQDSCDKIYKEAQVKKQTVFSKLKDLNFLPPDATIDTCPLFHGISAKNVSKARRHKQVNNDTMSFDRFQYCILEKLEHALKRDSKRSLASLLNAQEMFLTSVVNARKSLSLTMNLLPTVCEQALKTELSIFETDVKLCVSSDSISKTIRQDLVKLNNEFMDAGEHHLPSIQSVRQEFQSIRETSGIDPEVLRQIRVEELLVMDFVFGIKGAILDRTFNVLKHSIHVVLKESLSHAIGELILLTQTIRHPLIGRLVQRIFGATTEADADVDNLLKLHVVLDGLLETVDRVVNITLRREISMPLSAFDVGEVGNNPRPTDPQWRRKVVQTLLSKLDYKKVASSVIEVCDDCLLNLHSMFRETIDNYRVLNRALEGASLTSTVEHLRTDHVPRVAELAVRGHALRYVIERGLPVLQDQIGPTGHEQLYSCSSPLWCAGRDDCMVKVVAKSAVGQEVWKQTMLDCMHTINILQELSKCPANHLQLNGWFLPEPDKLFIVMERAEEDLLAALRRGMSWQKRADVAVDVAKGLEVIHKASYVYQDLKPQNIMISSDGTAKVNFCKPEKPFEKTQLGIPFHISPEMFRNHHMDQSSVSFDIYAFGSLLWVLCEGSGRARPQAYSNCHDIEAMKTAVCVNGIRPERPPDTPDTWWNLMEKCWSNNIQTIGDVLNHLLDIQNTLIWV